MKETEYPWADCKVAFDADVWDADHVFEYLEAHALPKGWELRETDSSGARVVVLFRVPAGPKFRDGQRVEALMKRLKQWSDRKHKEAEAKRRLAKARADAERAAEDLEELETKKKGQIP